MRLFDRDLHLHKSELRGMQRSRSARDTLAAVLPRCDAFGITRVANVTGLDYVGIPVYQAVRPGSRSLSVSQGKGLTRDAACASAVMESIEGWHAETMDVTTRYEPLRLLASHADVIDLDRLPRLSLRTLDPEVPMPWVCGYDLIGQRAVWVPYETVDLNRVQDGRAGALFQSSSKGLAAGNHLLEAILHGLCEVIEHDAHVLWQCDAADPQGVASLVDLSSIDDPDCRAVLDRFTAAGLTVAVHDITSDVGVPCYQAIAIDSPESFRPLGFSWGQGCHPCGEIALLRALTEAAQSRLTFIAGARDDVTYEEYASVQSPDQATALLELLRRAERPVRFGAHASFATATFEADLAEMLVRLRGVGCDSVVVVDLTHAEHQIPVVRVIVPGLEGTIVDSSRYIPGERARRRLAATERT